MNRMLSFLFLIFLVGCRKPPIILTPSIETQTPDYQPPETASSKTWEEEHSLPNQWDGGLFSETPCPAPCFAGITPGISTESQVMAIVENSDFFQNCEFGERPDHSKWIRCKGLIINIDKENGIVEGIGYSTLLEFTLEQVISKYGEPTTVWVAPEGIPETPRISMIILLGGPNIRLDLEDKEDTSGTYILEPSAKVTNVVYCRDENCGFTAYLQPWHKYGEYAIDDNWH